MPKRAGNVSKLLLVLVIILFAISLFELTLILFGAGLIAPVHVSSTTGYVGVYVNPSEAVPNQEVIYNGQ